MSYSNSFPQQRPTLNLDFANSGKLDSRISYSRSSTGTYMSSEKALNSENLLLQSQDFDTTWTVNHMSAPTGSQTAPDGSSTAWLLSAASGTGAATIAQNASPRVSSNTSYTLVCHVKAGTASHAYISFRGAPTESAYATIDFASPLSPTSGGSVMTGISSSSVALGNSWYRLSLTFTTSTISGGYSFIYVGTSDGTSPTSGGYVSYDSTGDTMYAWGAQLSSTNSKVYDSPTTTQISREFAPLLKTAAADAPRFEYAADGQSVGSGTALGLLIEQQKTNLIPGSDDFSTGWSIDNINVEANSAIAPNGTLSASLLRATGAAQHRIRRVVNVTSGNNYSASVYVKAAGYSHLFLGAGNPSTWGARAYFDISNGTVGTVINGAASIENVGNGYYRCVINGTAGASSGVYLEINVCEEDAATGFTSNDYGGLLAFGLQFEEGSASSLISTSGAAVTRSADSCSVATADIGYTGGDVSVISEFAGAKGYYPEVWELRDTVSKAAGVNDYILALKYSASADSSTNWRTWISESGNLTQTTISASSTATKLGVSVDSNSVASCADGGTIYNATSTVIPDSLDTLYIGRAYATTVSLNGHIKRLALYNVALSDTELQALTS